MNYKAVWERGEIWNVIDIKGDVFFTGTILECEAWLRLKEKDLIRKNPAGKYIIDENTDTTITL